MRFQISPQVIFLSVIAYPLNCMLKVRFAGTQLQESLVAMCVSCVNKLGRDPLLRHINVLHRCKTRYFCNSSLNASLIISL